MSRLKKRLGTGLVGLVLAITLLLGIVLLPGSVPASSGATSCGSIIKKIYSLNEGPPFYKAKVLIASGSVACSEARQVIWKSLKPGGFNGGLNGWQCESKGAYDPFIEKCSKEDPRQVIKSTKPKSCPSCHANRK